MALPENVSPGQEEKIRLDWRSRLKLKQANNVISRQRRQDLKPGASLKPKQNLPKAIDSAQFGNEILPFPNAPLPEQAGEENRGGEGEEEGTEPGNVAGQPEPGGPEKGGANENVAPRNEGRISRRLRQKVEAKRDARNQAYKKAGLDTGGSGMFARYRQYKKILRWVRGISLAGTALGDLIFSFSALFWSLILEWGFCKFKGWPMFKEPYQEMDGETGEMVEKWRDAPGAFLDKSIWYTGWIVVIVVVILVITLLVIINYVRENPVEALKYFPTLKNIGL